MMNVIMETLERMGLYQREDECGKQEEKDAFHAALYRAEVAQARAEDRKPRSWEDLMVPKVADHDSQ